MFYLHCSNQESIRMISELKCYILCLQSEPASFKSKHALTENTTYNKNKHDRRPAEARSWTYQCQCISDVTWEEAFISKCWLHKAHRAIFLWLHDCHRYWRLSKIKTKRQNSRTPELVSLLIREQDPKVRSAQCQILWPFGGLCGILVCTSGFHG